MKKTLTLFAFCALSVISMAQNHDVLWLLGYDSDPNNLDFGGTDIDFRQNPPWVHYHYRPMNFSITSAVMCDAQGNLLFYTNGIYVADSTDQPMLGGDTLSPPQELGFAFLGQRLQQGALALPWPSDSMRYCLFHMDQRFGTGNGATGFHLYYTEIDMRGNNGLGEVVSINNLLLTDTLDLGKLTACRHANGRDWWVVAPALLADDFYVLLLGPQGPSIQAMVHAGTPLPIAGGVGQAVFTQDGNKYIFGDATGAGFDSEFNVFDFDRCSGTLTHQSEIIFPYNDSICGVYVSVSPNSRFLYVSTCFKIYQYDLQAPNIEASRITVGEWDGFLYFNLYATISCAQLGPDGAIYWSSNGPYMHRIAHPNQQGLACTFEQRGVSLPTFNFLTIPNHPNYRLGPIDGSPCDTLGIDITAVAQPSSAQSWGALGLDAYPNPASTSCTIGMGRALPKVGRMEVRDMGGRLVEAHALRAATIGYGLNTSYWSNGSYVVTVWSGGECWGSVQVLIEN